MVQFGLLLGHHGLHANRIVFVDVEIVDVNLPVNGDGREHGAGVGRPGHVPHLGVEVEHEEWLAEYNEVNVRKFYGIIDNSLAVFIPDLDDPLRGAGDEDVGDEGVPLDVVDGRVVGGVGVEVAGGVLGGAEVDHPLIRAHQEGAPVIRLEGDGPTAVWDDQDDHLLTKPNLPINKSPTDSSPRLDRLLQKFIRRVSLNLRVRGHTEPATREPSSRWSSW